MVLIEKPRNTVNTIWHTSVLNIVNERDHKLQCKHALMTTKLRHSSRSKCEIGCANWLQKPYLQNMSYTRVSLEQRSRWITFIESPDLVWWVGYIYLSALQGYDHIRHSIVHSTCRAMAHKALAMTSKFRSPTQKKLSITQWFANKMNHQSVIIFEVIGHVISHWDLPKY